MWLLHLSLEMVYLRFCLSKMPDFSYYFSWESFEPAHSECIIIIPFFKSRDLDGAVTHNSLSL